jgi:hypothetical protein
MSYEMIDRFLRNNLGDDDYAEYSAALEAIASPQAALAEPSEPKMPPFFTQIEWLGNQARVHVFQRREDETPLNVCSQTHPASKPEPLTDDEITSIVRDASKGSAIKRDGSTSHRIARAVEAAVWAKFAAVKQDAAIKEKFE